MFTEKLFNLASLMHEITLWILVVLSVFSLSFIIEKWLTLRIQNKRSRSLNQSLKTAIETQNLKAIQYLGGPLDSLESKAISIGLNHIKSYGASGLNELFNAYALTEKSALEKKLNFLASVGSNAPFIGLLGTVFGVMDAFRGLAESQGEAAIVMLGISKALLATAVGLIVAIPATVAYNYFLKNVRGIMQSLESTKQILLSFAKTQGKAPN